MPRLVIRKGEAAGRDQALGGECIVGRHPQVQFVLNDHLVSRRHFRVHPVAGAWVLEDLGSTNGTLLNGQKVKREALRDGDVIAVGQTELVFVQKDLLGGGKTPPPRPDTKPAPVPLRQRKRSEAPVRKRRRH